MDDTREKILAIILGIPAEDWAYNNGSPEYVIYKGLKIGIATRFMNYTQCGLSISSVEFFSFNEDTRVKDYIEKLNSYGSKINKEKRENEVEQIYNHLTTTEPIQPKAENP